MPTILYRVTEMPEHGGWDAPAAPGLFQFEFKAVLEVYRARVAAESAHIHMHSRRNGIYREYVEAVEALAWLERKWLGYYQHEDPEAISWPEPLGSIRYPCMGLFITKRFVSVTCPACHATYSPDQVQAREFRHGESLAAHGGTGLLCPKGHGLYVILTWNS